MNNATHHTVTLTDDELQAVIVVLGARAETCEENASQYDDADAATEAAELGALVGKLDEARTAAIEDATTWTLFRSADDGDDEKIGEGIASREAALDVARDDACGCQFYLYAMRDGQFVWGSGDKFWT